MTYAATLNKFVANKSNKRSASRMRKNKKASGDGGGFYALSQYRTGFPKKLHMRHKYVDLIVATGTTGATVTQKLACNGMYDPDLTSAGHQPSFFDTLTSIYDHFTVFRSRVHLQIIADGAFRAALYIDDDTTPTTSAAAAAEAPSAARFLISPATTFRPLVMNRSWDAKDYFGGDIFDNDNLTGDAGGNPVELSVFTLLVAAANGTSTVNFTISVEMEFEAVWDELKTPVVS